LLSLELHSIRTRNMSCGYDYACFGHIMFDLQLPFADEKFQTG
jgi:hypothetical protein